MPPELTADTEITANLEAIVRGELAHRADTGYAIAKKAGISRQQMYRFIKGERGLTLDSLDKLCAVLGLTLVRVSTLDNIEARIQREVETRIKLKRL